MQGGTRRALVAVAAGLALADASIVALALPPILTEMHTTISGVAAIIGVYALVLAVAIWPASRLRVGPWGFALFAIGSLGCGVAGSLPLLLFFRALSAVGGAAALISAFALLDAGESRSGRRLWLGAALIGTAAGPAIGGALTEVFDWRAIFLIQVPLAAAAALACLRPAKTAMAPRAEPATEPTSAPGAANAPASTPGPRGEPQSGGLWSRGEKPAPRRSWDAPAPFRARGATPAHAAATPRPAAPGRDAAPASSGRDAAPTAPGRVAASASPDGDAVPAFARPRRRVVRETPARERATTVTASAAASPLWLGALACTAAAFTAVLFLLVLELVAGFAMSPLRAAFGVTVLPLAALAGAAIPGEARPKALAGSVLIAGGAAALAFLPGATIAWTIVPQLLAGGGMGLALPAFSTERTTAEAARNLVARHVGIVVVLAILAPVATAKLSTATDRAVLQGTSLVLDAQIDPLQKLRLAPQLLGDVDVENPRKGLTTAVDKHRAEFADDAAVYDRLAGRLDDVVVVAVQDAFRAAYLIAAALAVLAAALLVSAYRKPAVLLATAVAAATFLVYVVEHREKGPAPVVLEDPCQERDLPDTGGLAGALQDEALKLLDQAACQSGSSREEFALALFDPQRAKQFEKEHGVDPRSASGLLSLLGG